MRPRFAVPASLLATFAFAAVPAVGLAQKHVHHPPHHNRGVTIGVTTNPIVQGDSIEVYGQLRGPDNGGRQVNLYEHLVGSHRGYVRFAHTTTQPDGLYSFTLEPATNRSYFATAAGHDHSRTVYERVHARVTIGAPSTALTKQRVVIAGHVAPNHPRGRVVLQQQIGAAGNDYRAIASERLGADSNYRFVRRFAIAGDRTLRVVFPGDRRNLAGVSDNVSIAVSQAQNPAFTLNASADPITVGQSDTLSGILAASAAATNANVAVTLYQRNVAGGPFTVAQNGTTDASGSYSFTVQPAENTVYEVRTTSGVHTRQLFLGVHDSVTIAPSSTAATVGGSVTFTGTVAPSKVGHLVELQRQGPEGDYHTVASRVLDSGSSYSFARTFGAPGMKTYRVRETGGPSNEGGVSPSVTITVSQPPLSSLPSAS